MTSTAINIHTAVDLVEAAILGNDHALMQNGLCMLTECMAEALATRQFHLIEIANGRLRDNFKKLEILSRVKIGQLSEHSLALLLEYTAPKPNLIWNVGIKDMSGSLIRLLLDNFDRFWPNDFRSQSQLIQQLAAPEVQDLKAVVFERYLSHALRVGRADYEFSPLGGLDSIWNQKKSEYDRGKLSQPILDVMCRNKDAVIVHVIRDREHVIELAAQGKRTPQSPYSETSLSFPVVQQLYAAGFTDLPVLMLPAILGTQHDPRQFALAERMGVVIEKSLVKDALSLTFKDHFNLQALVYALESPSFSVKELAALMIQDKPGLRDERREVMGNQLKNIGPAIKAVYEKSGRHQDALVHDKTHVLLKWLSTLKRDTSAAKLMIINTKKLPQDILHVFPHMMEERLAKDIGL
jgi:hypothetical protein